MHELVLFFAAIIPLVAVAIGMLKYNQPGERMALMGWALTVIFAVLFFKTDLIVALGASWVGIIKSLGVTVAVMATMWQIFLMKEAGSLTTISNAVKKLAASKEEQALFVGLAFGSFLTALGVVTPALLPPLLLTMGFTPFASIAIAVLGYNASTSFALLSIPVTLPADAFGFSAAEFAWKIAIYLPVVSIGFAFGLLWLIGGKESMKKGAIPALLSGGTIAAVAVATTAPATAGIVPLRLVGVVAGFAAMVVLLIYRKMKIVEATKPQEESSEEEVTEEIAEEVSEEVAEAFDWKGLAKAASPWLVLVVVATIISVPVVDEFLSDLPGEFEVITVFDDPDSSGPIRGTTDDLNIGSQIYTWIFISTLLALPILKPTKEQFKAANTVWRKRVLAPSIAYSMFFAIALVMYHSAKTLEDGGLMAVDDFDHSNIDKILGGVMAGLFGKGYLFAAAFLGLFGGFAGGSETGSNVLFYQVQQTAASGLNLTDSQFMTMFGAHAVAGGIASGITPAKITNAAAVLGESGEIEGKVLKKHLAICLLLTVATGLMTVGFILI